MTAVRWWSEMWRRAIEAQQRLNDLRRHVPREGDDGDS